MPQSSTPKKKSCHKEQTSGSLLDPDNGLSHLSTSELDEVNLVRRHINEQLTIIFVDLQRPKTVIIAVFGGSNIQVLVLLCAALLTNQCHYFFSWGTWVDFEAYNTRISLFQIYHGVIRSVVAVVSASSWSLPLSNVGLPPRHPSRMPVAAEQLYVKNICLSNWHGGTKLCHLSVEAMLCCSR